MIRPNIFVIGAMKSGTTSLSAFLDMHPDIAMCPVKEPSYFAAPDQLKKHWKEMWAEKYWKSEECYLKLFSSLPENTRYVGEASTCYSKLPDFTGIPQRLCAFDPEARIVYLLRNPYKRTISHFLHDVRHEPNMGPAAAELTPNSPYFNYSDYNSQLEAYLEEFPPDQILCLTFEELTATPKLVLDQMASWLNIAPWPPGTTLPWDNRTPTKFFKPSGLKSIMYEFWQQSPLLQPLRKLLPTELKNGIRGTLQTRYPDIPNAIDDSIRKHHLDQTARLSESLGRKFPLWDLTPKEDE